MQRKAHWQLSCAKPLSCSQQTCVCPVTPGLLQPQPLQASRRAARGLREHPSEGAQRQTGLALTWSMRCGLLVEAAHGHGCPWLPTQRETKTSSFWYHCVYCLCCHFRGNPGCSPGATSTLEKAPSSPQAPGEGSQGPPQAHLVSQGQRSA